MTRTLVGVWALAAQIAMSSGVLDAIIKWDDESASWQERQIALDELKKRANQEPLVCIEIARRLGRVGDPALSGAARVFQDPQHGCHARLVQSLKILRKTGDDDALLYSFLTPEQIGDDPGFTEEVILSGNVSQASAVAMLIAFGPVPEYAPLLMRRLRERSWKPGEHVIQRQVFVLGWEVAWGECLLQLKDIGAAENSDDGFRIILESLDALATQGDGLTDDELKMRGRITRILAEPDHRK